jgi:hypothetical protein
MITEGNFIFQGQLITFLMQNIVGECGRHPFTLASMYDAYPNGKKKFFFVVFLDASPRSLINDTTRVDRGGVFCCR